MQPNDVNDLMLIYAHPLMASATIWLITFAMVGGLTLRRWRIRRRGAPLAIRKRHALLAKVGVVGLALSAAGGLLSTVLLRHWQPMQTTHGWIAAASLTLLCLGGWLGLRIDAGESDNNKRHGMLGILALLLALAASMSGIDLLP